MRHPPTTRVEARERYLFTPDSLADIAAAVGVPYNTLHAWYVSEKWPDQRRKLQSDLAERSQYERQRIVQENVGKVMRRHLDVGGKIEDQISKNVDEAGDKALSPSKLSDLARALSDSGKITGKVVGLDSHGSHGNDAASVNVLVNTNFTPVPAEPEPVAPPIPVEATEIDDEEPF